MTRPDTEEARRHVGREPRRDGAWPRVARRSALLVAPFVLAAVLTGVAVLAVDGAGCDRPAEFVTTQEGAFLVGGCDLPNTDTLAGVPAGRS